MAHYIAQKIKDAQQGKGKVKASAESEAARAILELWEHRGSYPREKRPFADFEPVVRLLEALNPSAPPYYRHEVWEAVDADAQIDSVRTWLKYAEAIDRTARMLIEEFLIRAASFAQDKGEEWVKLVRGTKKLRGPDIDLVILLSELEDHRENLLKRRAETVQERIDALDTLLEGAVALREELTLQLAEIGGDNVDETGNN